MSEQDIAYGGQAVIGGVMIQSPKGWSLGIRDKNDKLHKYYEERIPLIKRNKFWSAPLIRGSDFEEYEESLFSKIMTYSFLISVLLVFIAGPRLLVETINYSQSLTGVLEGLLRGLIVIVYIYLIGRTKDAQELFEYHGAEHMTIASYEAKKSLTMDDVKTFPKEHIRCGTSFLFLIVFISLLTLPFIPNFNIVLTAVTRILHVVVVSMLSYEVLKFNFANSNSLIAKFFAAPGIWTQFITTKKPSTDQIEVAILSMANCVENSENTKMFEDITTQASEVKVG